ncbi:MAG TPA: prolyl oligopeptidase family serine peptidase [Rhizomicrobium sp.]|nr:prolyl oligopeptidase family serine peptidase [Rhizomicrobium sp.]
MRLAKWVLGMALAATAGCVALAAELTPNSPDPWLWLADIHGARALAWVKDQDAKALAQLKSDPRYSESYDALLEILDANDRIPEGDLDHGDVYNFWQDKDHPRGLWRKTTIADYRNPAPHWDVLIDVDKLDAAEKTNWVWQGADCAPGNDHCLIRLSPGGSDAATVREFDPQTKSFIKDGFALPQSKMSAAYIDKDTILFATDFGPGSMTTSSYPRIVKLWRRGEPVSAARTVFEASPTDIAANLSVQRGPYGTVPIVIRGLSFFEAEFYYVKPDGTTKKLPLPKGANLAGVTGGNLVFTLRNAWTPPGGRKIAQGALVSFNVMAFAEKSRPAKFETIYTPGPHDSIDSAAAGRDAVFASIYKNVTGSIHAFRQKPDGTWSDEDLGLPAGGSTRIVSTNDWGPEAYFGYESFLKPLTLYEYDGTGQAKEIKSQPQRFDTSDLVSEQFWVTSKDGTKVPYFLIHRKDMKGPVPTILYSYGGFELSLTPWYWNDGHRPLFPGVPWFSKGGAIAVANIRGGGEFGPAWHQAALGPNHQKAFDDFQAVAMDLIRRGVTNPKHLGIVGASNGGLLVSATMVERPDLFGAVVCQRPLIDMLRYTKYGAGQSWVSEYGDPAIAKDRAWILKYSPYENLKTGVTYPPVLFITETSDDRVTPVFARMMAAKMEADRQDVLFYESPEGGHGPGATHAEAAMYWALSYTYFAQKLGLGAK